MRRRTAVRRPAGPGRCCRPRRRGRGRRAARVAVGYQRPTRHVRRRACTCSVFESKIVVSARPTSAVDVAADDQRPAVGELDVPGAEEVPAVRDRREGAEGRVPEPLRVRAAASKPSSMKHVPVRLRATCGPRRSATRPARSTARPDRASRVTAALEPPRSARERERERAHCDGRAAPRWNPSREPLGVGRMSTHE